VIRHARWIAEGKLHPASPADIPANVMPWVDPVGEVLFRLRNPEAR
jgi:hypothetical protein